MLRTSDMHRKEKTVVLSSDLNEQRLIDLVNKANGFSSYILIQSDGVQINIKSFLSVINLLQHRGKTMVISAEGPDADQALDGLLLQGGDCFVR